MRRRHYIAALLLVPLVLLIRYVAEVGERRPGVYTVIRVIDGDTAELSGGETIRLLGIDTPEQDEPYCEAAREYLAGMILGKPVRVELGERKRDGYGRLLGYIYIDTILVNARMLENGMGWLYFFPEDQTNKDATDRLLAAQRQAMARRVGVWTLPVFMEEKQYIANGATMRFHRPECESIRKMSAGNQVVFGTRESAMYEGYSPCRTCKP